MLFKSFLYISIVIVLLIVVFFSFALDKSYQKSVNAKMYFFMGEYDNAIVLAKEAYEMDKYNKMAFSIMQQSEISKNFQVFVEESNEYYEQINKMLVSKNYIDKSDKYKIKMMTEIVMDGYKKIEHSKTRITDKNLVIEAEKIYKEFKAINEKINEKL